MTVATALAASDVTTRLPAQDLDRARRWYSDKLGLDPGGRVEVNGAPGSVIVRAISWGSA